MTSTSMKKHPRSLGKMTISIRVHPKTRGLLSKAATEAGVSMSEVAEHLIVEGLVKGEHFSGVKNRISEHLKNSI